MAQPDILKTAFGENAAPETINDIPETRAPTDPPQKATWSTGFPKVTMTPLVAGGVPPMGQDVNGVLKAISEHVVYQNKGGMYKWSSDAAPYAKGAVIQSDDERSAYVSLVDGNNHNPNTAPAQIGVSWAAYSGTALTPDATSTVKGVVQLASAAEALAGVNDTKAVTPKTLADKIGDTVVQATGQSTTKVMSQKAVTDAIGYAPSEAPSNLSWLSSADPGFSPYLFSSSNPNAPSGGTGHWFQQIITYKDSGNRLIIAWPYPTSGNTGTVKFQGVYNGSPTPEYEFYHSGNFNPDTKVNTTTQIIAGTGLTGGGTLAANRTLSVSYGTTAGTAAQGNDSRITGAMQKSANLGDVTNAATARGNLGLGTAATRNVGVNQEDIPPLYAIGYTPSEAPSDLSWLSGSAPGFSPYLFNSSNPNAPSGGTGHWFQQIIRYGDSGNRLVIAWPYPTSGNTGTVKFQGVYNGSPTPEYEFYHSGNLPIVQTTGTSDTNLMSQKAVTDAINNSAIGVGQTWQNMTASRAAGTTYTNTTGRPIQVSVTQSAVDGGVEIVVGGMVVAQCGQTAGEGNDLNFVQAIVPSGGAYMVRVLAGVQGLTWVELR